MTLFPSERLGTHSLKFYGPDEPVQKLLLQIGVYEAVCSKAAPDNCMALLVLCVVFVCVDVDGN